MIRGKKTSILLATIMSLSILAGCSKASPAATQAPKTEPAKTEAPKATEPAKTEPAKTEAPKATEPAKTSTYKDGTYKVEFDKFDANGWKGQLELTVKTDKITAVKFDYVNKDGKLKSADAAYKAAMEPKTKTYPAKFIPELQQKLIDKQDVAAVDAVAGATGSTNEFKTLAKYALDEMAKKGVTTPAVIPAK
jgi:major membrane immunogen (membrane-anchored lipoprotein)